MIPVLRKLRGPEISDTAWVRMLREVDAFACSDVLLAGLFAFWLNVDNIAKWIGSNQFPELVDGIYDLSGVAAIGMDIKPWLVGVLGVALATLGSLVLYV